MHRKWKWKWVLVIEEEIASTVSVSLPPYSICLYETDLCQFTSLKLTFIALTFTTIYHLYIRYINFISSKLTFIKLAVSTLHQTYPNLSLDDKLLDRLSNLSLRLSDLSLKPISEMYLRSISSLSSFSSYPWGTWCTSGAFVLWQCCNAATVQRCVGLLLVSSCPQLFIGFFILSARLTCVLPQTVPAPSLSNFLSNQRSMKFIVKLSSVQLMSSDVVHQPWQSYLQPYSHQTWLFQTKFIKLIATYRHLSLSNSLPANLTPSAYLHPAYLSKCPFFLFHCWIYLRQS